MGFDGEIRTTRTGKVVYRRKRHPFTVVDVKRIVLKAPEIDNILEFVTWSFVGAEVYRRLTEYVTGVARNPADVVRGEVRKLLVKTAKWVLDLLGVEIPEVLDDL